MSGLFWLAWLVTLLNFLQQIWGARAIFSLSEKGEPPKFLWIKLLAPLFMIGLLASGFVYPQDSERALWLVVAGMVAADIVFWAAYRSKANTRLSLIFSDDLPDEVLQRGIYAYIRHPFYASYILAYASAAGLSAHWATIIPALVMTFIYFDAAKGEEAKFRASRLREEYDEYTRRAGRFLPKPWVNQRALRASDRTLPNRK